MFQALLLAVPAALPSVIVTITLTSLASVLLNLLILDDLAHWREKVAYLLLQFWSLIYCLI